MLASTKYLLLNVANKDFQDGLDSIPDTKSQMQNTIDNANNSIQFVPTHTFLEMMHKVNGVLTIAGILTILIGLIIMARSKVGDNGKSRRSAAGFILIGVLGTLLVRVAPIMVISLGQLDKGRFLSFLVTFVFQLVFFVGSVLQFMIASQELQLHEFSGQQSLLASSKKSYQYVYIFMGAGFILYLVMVNLF